MLRIPGAGQDKQQAWRWTIGAWPDLPAFVRLSVRRKSDKHQGPSQNQLKDYQQASHTLAAAVWA
eukprot:1159816-Pelagomonas_calceolata.AAC.4